MKDSIWKKAGRKLSSTAGQWMAGHGGNDVSKIIKKGPAMRVIFFYPGEEGTYIDNAEVTLFENGIVHIRSPQEETTTHLQNCEILWNYELESDERGNKVRLLKLKSEARAAAEETKTETKSEGKNLKNTNTPNSSKNPESK